MCTYLSPQGSTYYFRRLVPVDVQAQLGRKEWSYSLRTKDRNEAKRRVTDEVVKTNSEIDAARATLASQPPTQRVRSRFAPNYDGPTPEEQEVMALFDREADAREWRYEERAQARKLLEQRFRGTTASLSPIEAAARDLVREAKYNTALANDQRMIAGAKAKELTNDAPAVPPSSPAPKATRLMALFDAYVAERKPAASTVRSWGPVMAHLIAYLGHDDARRVEPRNLIEWKNLLLTERSLAGNLRAARTVADVYLASVKVVLGWAVDNLVIPANPAVGIKVRVPKAVKLREPGFTDAEALTILRAALVPPDRNLSPENVLARRWVPWLCAYTGARVNEIGQLRGQDVQYADGIWTIRITPEAGTTKNNAARVVPLHAHLVEQGFPAIAEGKGLSPLFFNPSQQRKAGDASRQFKKVGERLANWVRNDLGITDTEVLPNHGWRHMFKTNARRCNMDHTAMDRIQGHAAKTEGDKYGYFPMATLAAEIAKLPRFAV